MGEEWETPDCWKSHIAGTLRSYFVLIPSRQISRNRHHLNIRREDPASDISLEVETSAPVVEAPTTMSVPHAVIRSPIMTRSQIGTVVRLPDRFT